MLQIGDDCSQKYKDLWKLVLYVFGKKDTELNRMLFLHNNEIEQKSLKDIAEIGTGTSNRQEACPEGKYPFFVRSKNIEKKDSYEFDEEAIIIPGEGGVGEIFHYMNGKYALHQRAYRIHILDKKLNTRFLYYYLENFFKAYIKKYAMEGTVLSIRKPIIEEFFVPIFPLKIQREIVNILDKFNDKFFGLKKEIENREIQTSYYLNDIFSYLEENKMVV